MTLGDSSLSDPASSPSSPRPTSLLPLPLTPLASNTSHPSIPQEHLMESSWGDAALLDKTLNNYTAWSQHILHVLCLSGLNIYLDGSLPTPDPHLEPCANRNWRLNSSAIGAFLIMKCVTAEREFVEKCVSADKVWSTLRQHHIHQGPMSQVNLIQEALSVRYSSSVTFSQTMLVLCDLNQFIWDMGAPTPEGFLCILMLVALSSDESLSSVCDSIVSGLSSSQKDHTYTLVDIVAWLDYEQQSCVIAVAKTIPVPAKAHVTHTSSSLDSKQSICSNCKRPQHTAEFCVQHGGGMVGKSISDAQQARNAKHGKKPKEKSKATLKGTAGSILQSGNQAFILDVDCKAHEIINATPSLSVSSTIESAHFLVMNNLVLLIPLSSNTCALLTLRSMLGELPKILSMPLLTGTRGGEVKMNLISQLSLQHLFLHPPVIQMSA